MRSLGRLLDKGKRALTCVAVGLATVLPMKVGGEGNQLQQPQKIEQTAKNYGLNWANLKDVNKDGVVNESDYFDMRVDDFEQYLQKTMTRPGSPDNPPPEINQGDMINPYKEPNDRELKYGRGDVNADGKRDSLDYQLMVAGDQSDASDVDMDGSFTQADIDSFFAYINGEKEYLPAEYNKLQTPDERKQWYDYALLLDGIDGTIIPWHDGTPDERFISGNYSYGSYKAIYGFMKLNQEDNDEHVKYSFIENGKFNGPMYMAVYYDPSTGIGHGMNAAHIGRIDSLGVPMDDPRDIENWLAIEPQTNGTIMIGDWIPAPNMRFAIYAARDFNSSSSPDMPRGVSPIVFMTDSTGNIYVNSQNPDLTLERPDWISTLPDALPPEITITNPKQDTTYTEHITNLEYLISDANQDSMWYSTDNGQMRKYVPWGEPITGLKSKQGENTWALYAKDWVGHESSDSITFNVDTTTNNINYLSELPEDYSLNQNYPNPFNSSTTIGYSIPEGGPVSLIIYNIVGKELETLVNQEQSPGSYKVPFDASKYASGVYFYQLRAGDYTETEKMALIK